MKKALNFFLAGFVASAMIFSFASCSDDDEDEKTNTQATTNGENGNSTTTTTGNNGTNGSTTTTTESTNPFSGKTWRVTDEESGDLVEYVFTNETMTNTWDITHGNHTHPHKFVVTAKYTYDTEKSLLYLTPSHIYSEEDGEEIEYSSISEIEAACEAHGFTGTELAYQIASLTAEFRTKTVYKYEITGKTLKLTYYFDGTLPPCRRFENDNDSYDIEFDSGEIKFENRSIDAKYYIFPTCTDGNFSGTVFKRIYENGNEVFTNLGNAAGTYSTSGTGTKGCTITLKFTALPDDAATAISLNTDYVLDQESEDSEEYTLVE